MPVDAATIAELQAAPVNDYTTEPLLALTSVEAVYSYEIARARADGRDECDAVEIIARAANKSPGSVRASAGILRRLGFHLVADRLVEIAGKRKHSLRPLDQG